MKKLIMPIVCAFLFLLTMNPDSLFAQTRVQKILTLSLDSEQKFLVIYGDQFLAPAVRIGNQIMLGYASEAGSTQSPQCITFHYVENEEAIPDSVEEFMGVVVGSGNQIGFLWREPFTGPDDCPGWVPPPPSREKD